MSRVASSNMMAEINVTPLVDVMLVLLVIFMLVTPAITYSNSQTVAPPDKQSEAKPQRLIVQAGDTFQLDGQSIVASELKQHFVSALKADAKYSLQIFGEPEASYETFAHALAIAKNAGVENVSLASSR